MLEKNEFTLVIDSNSKNEAFARVSVASFATQLNPTLDEINDIKMAVSEAVTNAIIHGYEESYGKIYIYCVIKKETIHIKISDKGKGIKNISKAMEPLFTSKPHLERSGMGFTIMETFMDKIVVKSIENKGTTIYMYKKIRRNEPLKGDIDG